MKVVWEIRDNSDPLWIPAYLQSLSHKFESCPGSHHTPMLITDFLLTLLDVPWRMQKIPLIESLYHYQDFQSYLSLPASDFFDDGLLAYSPSNVDNNIVYGIVWSRGFALPPLLF